MGCANCSAGGCGVKSAEDSNPSGCKSSGSCGCNRMNSFDWLSDIQLPEYNEFDVVEVSFKNGSRKGFYINQSFVRAESGDNVVVESGTGYDVGTVTLTGELVRLQMKKKKVSTAQVLPNIIRKSNERDFERLKEARALEYEAMVQARAISRSLKLDMKVGDVEYQGDKRKATFYYTADGRVDFRELIKLFAKEFKVKIEMRQIGARQESARIGGLGSCGRELCCSTWLTDFKSVSTAAARYQNLAINQSKLSGQCGRLKCCLNYELDTYMDALTDFPKKADFLQTEVGKAFLVKTDIFKKIMFYQYRDSKNNKFYALDLDRVKFVLAMNAEGKKPLDLMPLGYEAEEETVEEPDYRAVNDVFELAPMEKRKRRRRSRNKLGNPEPNAAPAPIPTPKRHELNKGEVKKTAPTPKPTQKPTVNPKVKTQSPNPTPKVANKPPQRQPIKAKPQAQEKTVEKPIEKNTAPPQPQQGVERSKSRFNKKPSKLKAPNTPQANKPLLQKQPTKTVTPTPIPNEKTTENKEVKRKRRNNRNRNRTKDTE